MDPKNQTFFIAGPDGAVNVPIWMAEIDARRVRLANICISYGVQLGLCLMTLLATLTLVPVHRMRKYVHIVHVLSLAVAVTRLTLFLTYFSGPLSEFYVSWSHDPTILDPADYYVHIVANAFNPVQFALIEAALIMQTWNLMETCWSSAVWQEVLIKASAVLIAVATVAIKSVWVAHYIAALLARATLPIPLDSVGQAATVMGAVSIFYFCGIFFLNLTRHLQITRGLLHRSRKGLTSLEILTIGNGILMVLPSVFAGLDIAASLSGTRVLPFDAGSWVQTFVVVGLPLIGLIARYRGPSSRNPSRRISLFANMPMHHHLHGGHSKSHNDDDYEDSMPRSFIIGDEGSSAGAASRSRSLRAAAALRTRRSSRDNTTIVGNGSLNDRSSVVFADQQQQQEASIDTDSDGGYIKAQRSNARMIQTQSDDDIEAARPS
ncbi:pheromone alpha factor receptor [Apiospora kogelbergensis]|uniref:Pheromone alpha factor receptor n=1 Tax=Apiospora kogelbergensis TaxID=1337665 RepID=A0AAW0R3L1_9PEZI